MAQANTAKLATLHTDFNVTPYYDDYSVTKNFHRILFKPGFAVQARELTQIQTILQNQIDRFGKHIFRDGSMVLGGKPYDLATDMPYVKIKDNDINGAAVNLTLFDKKIVTGQTTGCKAYVTLSIDGVETETNTKTLYIRYTAGGTDPNNNVFAANETLLTDDGASVVVLGTSPTGVGSMLTIEAGVVFAKQHFIHFDKQSVVVGRYSTEPTCRVGLLISEDIIKAAQDSSLLDPALESSNFAAPGADRLKLDPVLITIAIDGDIDQPDYLDLFIIKGGVIQEAFNRTTYNIIGDEIARRTSNESGDYVIRGFDAIIKESYDNGINYGLSTSGNSSNLVVGIKPGLGYVKGYEVQGLSTRYIEIDKSTAYANVGSTTITSRLGNYVYIEEVTGSALLDQGMLINLLDQPQNRVSNGAYSGATSWSGKTIGTARVGSLDYLYGRGGTVGAAYKLYLNDIKMLGSNNFANVRSVYFDHTAGSGLADFGADILLTIANTASLVDASQGVLLYPAGNKFARSIKDAAGTSNSTSFMFRQTANVTIFPTTGNLTVTISSSDNESFPYGVRNLSVFEKQQLILSVNAPLTKNLYVSVSNTTSNGLVSVTGTAAGLLSKFNPGETFGFANNGVTETYVVTQVLDNQTINVYPTLTRSITANNLVKVYRTGSLVDLASNSSTGTARTITQNSATQLVINLQETYDQSSSITGTISYYVTRGSAREIKKTLNSNRYVKINVASAVVSGTPANGFFDLGISDVYRVRQIRKKTGDFTTATEGSNVTAFFSIDNGQRDDVYTHASIRPSSITLANSDYLLIELDHFVPDLTQGAGYFSIDSYTGQVSIENIPSYTSTVTGTKYDLRGYLDFRPVKVNTADSSTTVAGATINPSSTANFVQRADGMRMLADTSAITFAYTYYLSRIDNIVVDRNGIFSVVKGVPGTTPVTPFTPDGVMSLATIIVKPYPSLSPEYADVLDKRELACQATKTIYPRFTMRDIGVLKQRIDALEYYVSLNSLEKSATDLKIQDQNGADRFKNGIYVDTFDSQNLQDTTDPDNRIYTDLMEKAIKPVFSRDSFGYNYASGTNVQVTGDLVSLPYTKQEIQELRQPYANTNWNIETAVYRFIGNMTLTPPYDFATDNQRSDPKNIVLNGAQPEGVSQVGSVTTYNDELMFQIYDGHGGWYDWLSYSEFNRRAAEQVPQVKFDPYSVTFESLEFKDGRWRVSSSVVYNALIDPTANNKIIGSTPVTSTALSFYELKAVNPTGFDAWQKFMQNELAKKGVGYDANFTYRFINRKTASTQSMQQKVTTSASESLGSLMLNAQNETFITGQIINISVTGLKPRTRYYTFFDGVNMDKYVTPSAAKYSLTGALTEGASIISADDGTLVANLRLPSANETGAPRFVSGQKSVIVTESTSNDAKSSSYARNTFTAQRLQITTQDTTISTRVISYALGAPQVGAVDTNVITQYSCSAYSFILKTPDGVEGFFLSGFDVYIAAKDPSLGCIFEIREMDNASSITRVQVPFSEVYLKNSDMIVTPDASTPTHIDFASPVFLQGNRQYALVIHTEGLNPNTQFWVSVLGTQDITPASAGGTGKVVNARRLTGTMYYTNNNLNWNIVDDYDLKVNFYRAVFNTSVTGQFIIGNKGNEYLIANSASTPLTNYGELFKGKDTLTISALSPGGSNIFAGDYIVGANSGVNSAVITASAPTYYMSNTGYLAGETISVIRSNGTTTTIASSITTADQASGKLSRYNEASNKTAAWFTSSNGKFVVGDTMKGMTTGQTFNIESIDRYSYTSAMFTPSELKFARTTTRYEMATTTNTAISSLSVSNISSFTDLQPKILYTFTEEKALYSKTTEVNSLSSSNSNLVRVTFISPTDYLSPILDLGTTSTEFRRNIVNSDFTDENKPSGGSLINKYISGTVNLADGQDAEDFNLYLTAFRPKTTDVAVWIKFSHREDSEPIKNRSWIQLINQTPDLYSIQTDPNDYHEYVFKIPVSNLTGTINDTTGIMQYINDSGIIFTGFKQFRIKIGLSASNVALVPKVADVRGIALQI